MASRKRPKPDGSNAGRPKRPKEWDYLVIWEFQVCEGIERRFEKVYGSDGDWARFFRQDESYITTELVHTLAEGRTYLTLDLWTSQEAYDAFRKQHLAEYEKLDRKYEELTEREREIGGFVRVSRKSA